MRTVSTSAVAAILADDFASRGPDTPPGRPAYVHARRLTAPGLVRELACPMCPSPAMDDLASRLAWLNDSGANGSDEYPGDGWEDGEGLAGVLVQDRG